MAYTNYVQHRSGMQAVVTQWDVLGGSGQE